MKSETKWRSWNPQDLTSASWLSTVTGKALFPQHPKLILFWEGMARLWAMKNCKGSTECWAFMRTGRSQSTCFVNILIPLAWAATLATGRKSTKKKRWNIVSWRTVTWYKSQELKTYTIVRIFFIKFRTFTPAIDDFVTSWQSRNFKL